MKNLHILEKAKKENKEHKLCERGFLISTFDSNQIESRLPYLAEWEKKIVAEFVFYVHKNQSIYIKDFKRKHYFLIGHAYNPFDGIIDENDILECLCKKDSEDEAEALDYINSLTGIFLLGKIEDNHITVLLDCAGMMAGFYGLIGSDVVITSHTVMPATVFELGVSNYVRDLLKYKFYPLYGGFLPGDISPYDEIKRIVPNTLVQICGTDATVNIKRFYPVEPLVMVESDEEYRKIIERICELMKKSMMLIAQKWEKPAISLTGGMDSKTTLAAAKENYDSFSYFSYITSKAEQLDANAAHKICQALQLRHKIYSISDQPARYNNYELVKEILQYNKDYVGKNNNNDICKRIFFDDNSDFDVEVKSWVSEIARANYYKKFGKKKMPKNITPRRCSTLYKVFLHNRELLRKTDLVFAEYIEKTSFEKHLYNYDWSDMFLWEIRYGSWGGLVITSEHKYSFDITIPYNNRKLLTLMLSTPLEKRRKDLLHEDLIKHMNAMISDTGITVVNMNETKGREILEKCYFNLNSNLPF